MEILVTGETGFVGAHLVRRLLTRGHRVRSLDKNRGLFDDELSASGAWLRYGISPRFALRRHAKRELGYQPRVCLKEGLSRTALWYRKAGYLGIIGHLTALLV